MDKPCPRHVAGEGWEECECGVNPVDDNPSGINGEPHESIYWNYRVFRKVYKSPAGFTEAYYNIHSVHYREDGKAIGWSSDPVYAHGCDEFSEIEVDLELMQRAFKNPIVDTEKLEGWEVNKGAEYYQHTIAQTRVELGALMKDLRENPRDFTAEKALEALERIAKEIDNG